MHYTALVGLTIFLATANAAPNLTLRQNPGDCTVTWHGSNSEGGGGPGQEPINNNAWSLKVAGGSKEFMSSEETDFGGFSVTVAAADYGGAYDITARASWNFGGNSWNSCDVDYPDGTSPGAVGPQNIDSGTVSVTSQDCTILFPGCG